MGMPSLKGRHIEAHTLQGVKLMSRGLGQSTKWISIRK